MGFSASLHKMPRVGAQSGFKACVKISCRGKGVSCSTAQSLSGGARRKGPPSCAGSRLALSTGSRASRRGMISGPLPRCFYLEVKRKGNVFMAVVSVAVVLCKLLLCRKFL